jgi:hypothetical protein
MRGGPGVARGIHPRANVDFSANVLKSVLASLYYRISKVRMDTDPVKNGTLRAGPAVADRSICEKRPRPVTPGGVRIASSGYAT